MASTVNWTILKIFYISQQAGLFFNCVVSGEKLSQGTSAL